MRNCAWNDRAIRRMIRVGKLAARQIGKDSRENGAEQECPICILHYDEINRLRCCNATICTECYLQVQDPKDQKSPCPFCKKKNMNVFMARRLGDVEKAKREAEEQKVIEATIKARKNSESLESFNTTSTTIDTDTGTSPNLTRSPFDEPDGLGEILGDLGDLSLTEAERRFVSNVSNGMHRNPDFDFHRHLFNPGDNNDNNNGPLHAINEEDLDLARQILLIENAICNNDRGVNVNANTNGGESDIYLSNGPLLSEENQLELAIQMSLRDGIENDRQRV